MLSRHGVVLVSALPSTALAIIRHEVRVERSDMVVCAHIITLSFCLHFIPAATVIIAAVECWRLLTRELGLVGTSSGLHMLRLLLLIHHLLLLHLVHHHDLVRMLMLMLLNNSQMYKYQRDQFKTLDYPFLIIQKRYVMNLLGIKNVINSSIRVGVGSYHSSDSRRRSA